MGNGVRVYFVGKGHLGHAEAPHSAAKRRVGVDQIGIHADIRNIIGSRRMDRGLCQRILAQAHIGPGIADNLNFPG